MYLYHHFTEQNEVYFNNKTVERPRLKVRIWVNEKALSTTGLNHQHWCPRHAVSHNIHHIHRPEGKLMSFCLKLIFSGINRFEIC